MITISVSDTGTSPVAIIMTQEVGPNTPHPKLGLQSVINTSAVYRKSVGGLSQGRKSWGKLRDKAVMHADIKATLSLAGTSHIYAHTVNGVMLKTTANASQEVAMLVNWGDTSECAASDSFIHPARTDRWLETSLTAHCEFHGDGLRAVAISYLETVIRKNPSREYVSTECTKSITSYYRTPSGGIYRSGTQTLYGGVRTKSACIGLYVSTYYGATTGGSYSSGTVYAQYGSITTLPVLAAIASMVEVRSPFSSLDTSWHPTDYGDLAYECAAQLKYVNSNVFLVAFDIANWRNVLSSLKNSYDLKALKKLGNGFYKLIKNRKKNSAKDLTRYGKALGSAYLVEKYVVKTSVSDADRLLAGAKKFFSKPRSQRIHSRRITSGSNPPFMSYTHQAHCTVECAQIPSNTATEKVQWAIGEAKKWGMYPGLINLWDIVTYSFVVDWFVQFGDLFEDVDKYLDMKFYFPVHYVILSEKWEGNMLATDVVPEYPVTGVITTCYYHRWISSEVPLPAVSLSSESKVGKHLLESTALILQRTK